MTTGSSRVVRAVDYEYMRRVASNVFHALGSGHVENIYHKAIVLDVMSDGIKCECEKVLPIWYKNTQIGVVRADIFLNDEIIVELKAVALVQPAHYQQVRRYGVLLGTTKMMLINFPTTPGKCMEIFAHMENGEFMRLASPLKRDHEDN